MSKKSDLFLKLVKELDDSSGFLNVSKIKSDTIKGFKWTYRYEKNCQNKTLTNVHLCILKYYVLLNNLEWKIVDNDCANKSINLEKSNYYLYDTGSGILFLDIINNENSLFNGFWHYKFNEIEIIGIDFNKLKTKVLDKNLPWVILNENNAINSSKLDLTLNFESGISMVTKIKHDIYHVPYQWAFIYENSTGEYKYMKNDDLNMLKKQILKNNFSWKIIDENKFNNSLNDNKINLKKIKHFKWSYTGFYRVKKRKYDDILQGFLWTYRYKENYKQTEISSVNLLDLKQKVLDNGLEWKILDENKANESLKENDKNFIIYGFHTNKNKTGIYRVYKSKTSKTNQGFIWCYQNIINKKRHGFSSKDLKKLKEKVLNNGFRWEVIDEYLAEKSFKENEYNMKKFYKN